MQQYYIYSWELSCSDDDSLKLVIYMDAVTKNISIAFNSNSNMQYMQH